MSNPIDIAVFTGARSEYGLLKPLLDCLFNSIEFNVYLFVSGSHLSHVHGNTINEIYSDGFSVYETIDIVSNDCLEPSHICSQLIGKFSDSLSRLRPDCLLLLGDRYETLAAAFSAHLLSIPIIHLHGGEDSFGSMDDKSRHAITQLSTLHFASCEKHAIRIRQMCPHNRSIFSVGPLAIDNLSSCDLVSRKSFTDVTGFVFAETNILVTFHPESFATDNGLSSFMSLLNFLDSSGFSVLFTSPNADPGYQDIIDAIHVFLDRNPNSVFVKSLGHSLYSSALYLFDVMAGNSSSGIIEAPLTGLPVINIGTRQDGRHCFGPVIHSSSDLLELTEAFRTALSHKRVSVYMSSYDSPRQLIYNSLVDFFS